MPIGPFRTYSQPVNLRDLDRFDAGTEVTPEVLKEAGLIGSVRKDVKILGAGDLGKSLSISAHGFSRTAREKIEAAGGSVTWLRGEPGPKRERAQKRGPRRSTEPAAAADETVDAEPEGAAKAAEGEG
jgi:large subunit ribosomal protein L15